MAFTPISRTSRRGALVTFLVSLAMFTATPCRLGNFGNFAFVSDAIAQTSSAVVSRQEAWTAIEGDSILVDVRTLEEFDKGHLKGSLHIPYDEIAARIGELGTDKSKTVVVYCKSGRRAGIAAATLRGSGFSSVVNAGAYEDLKAATPSKCQRSERC